MKKFFEGIGNIIGLFVFITILSHGYFLLFKSNVKIVGLYKVKPIPGYTWKGSMSDREHYLWDETDAKWTPGISRPDFHVIADEQIGSWKPAPGYTFADTVAGNLTTSWLPGKKHPDYHVVASDKEGSWQPEAGYKWIDSANADNLKTVWVPGILHPTEKAISDTEEGKWHPFPGYRFTNFATLSTAWGTGTGFNDLHIFSSDTQDDYMAYPGYVFVDDGKDLNVKWTPGQQNYLEPQKISGQNEGEWNTNPYYTPSDNRTPGIFEALGSLFLGALNKKIEEKVGDNFASDAIDHKMQQSFFHGIGQAITNQSDDPYNGIKPSTKHIRW